MYIQRVILSQSSAADPRQVGGYHQGDQSGIGKLTTPTSLVIEEYVICVQNQSATTYYFLYCATTSKLNVLPVLFHSFPVSMTCVHNAGLYAGMRRGRIRTNLPPLASESAPSL